MPRLKRPTNIAQINAELAKLDARRATLENLRKDLLRQEVTTILKSAGLSHKDVFGAQHRGPGRPPKVADASTAAAKPVAPVVKSAAGKRGRRQRRVSKPAPAAAGTRANRGTVYANPSDASQTWRGFGTRPGWFKQAIASGKSEKDLRQSVRPAASNAPAKARRSKPTK